MSTAGALISPRQSGWRSNRLRANGERQDPTWKSSNRRSTSRRRLSNGRHSTGRSVPFPSFLTDILVAASAIGFLLTLLMMAFQLDNHQFRRVRGSFFDLNQESHITFCGSLPLVLTMRGSGGSDARKAGHAGTS